MLLHKRDGVSLCYESNISVALWSDKNAHLLRVRLCVVLLAHHDAHMRYTPVRRRRQLMRMMMVMVMFNITIIKVNA